MEAKGFLHKTGRIASTSEIQVTHPYPKQLLDMAKKFTTDQHSYWERRNSMDASDRAAADVHRSFRVIEGDEDSTCDSMDEIEHMHPYENMEDSAGKAL